jgi:hypothetical protein
MKSILTILLAVSLTGCATAEYQAYADVHKAQAAAQAARYKALADIAAQGDTTAKVAAVMSLQIGSQQPQSQVAAPKSFGDHLLQWTSILLPTATQVYSINKQASTSIAQSNNATALGISTNQAFVGIAGKIQAPAANVTTTIGANSGANSGNSGRLAGTSITDNTSTPTVVTQPTPVVVVQPAPVIVRTPETTPVAP